MSELVKINLIRKFEEIGIVNHYIKELIQEGEHGEYNVYDKNDNLLFCLTKKAYDELGKEIDLISNIEESFECQYLVKTVKNIFLGDIK